MGVLLSIGAFSASAQSNPAAFDLSGGDYSMTEWSSSSPAGTYPTSMVFHTFENRIEFGNLDEAPNGDWTFEYDRTSRARMTGEDADGIGFNQTSSYQADATQPTFMGAAVLALNTTGRGDIMVSWVSEASGTLGRPYALRLQYRIGDSGPWQNAMDGVDPVQFSASDEWGNGRVTVSTTLPATLSDRALVQLRWLYFQDGAGSGSRPTITLDDVAISSDVYTGGPILPAYATTDGSLLSGYAGTPLRPVTIRIYTGDNNIDLGYSETLTVSKVGGTAGSLTGTLSVTANQGVAVFDNIMVSSPGTITLRVSVPNVDDQVFSTVLILPTPVVETNIVPQYIYGKFRAFSGFHTPSYAHVTFTDLTPNSKYRFVTGVNSAQEMYPTSSGPGFNINYDQTQNSYDYSGGKSVTSQGDYSVFSTGDNETTKHLWVNLVPTISDEFWPMTELYWQIQLADGNGNQIKIYQLDQTSMTMTNTTDDEGATLIGDRNSQLHEKNFVVLYDNEAGTGQPLATAIVQSYNTTVSFATNRYRFDIENEPGAWMTQIPNTLTSGVRRIEERHWKTGDVVYAVTSADGDWNGTSTYPYDDGPGSFFSPIYLNTPTITVSFPAAGDTLCAGRLYTIQYRADGMDNVKIEYSIDGGANYSTIVNSTSASAGRYEWAVPGVGFEGNCYIRVTGVDRPNESGMSGSFTIVEPLALIQPISSKNLCLGATDTLIALVAGSVESYTWYKDGQVIPLADGPVLLLSDVQYNSAGVYWCEVEGYGACGNITTNMSHVRVARQTRLVNQTYAVPGIIGETVTMFVQAEFPDEVISYQWYKGQDMLTDDGHYYGTESSRLEIRNFAEADYGNDYHCEIVGVCGTVTSRVVRVFPTGVYVEFVNPEFSVCGSGDVEVEALVYSNPEGEDLNIQWYRNGIALSNGAIYEGVTTSTLTIKNATAAQAGEYTVRASLAVEPSLMGEATATVVIATPPTITDQPASSDVCAGESITLSVNVNAAGSVSYQWFQDGTEVPGATDASYEIANATDVRAGEYTVEITTACGTITSDAATVTVKPATEITTQPEATIDIAAGETLTLTVAATGSGTVQYQWFKDGTELTGEVAATYTKMNTTADDAGQYWCRVQAECGDVLSDTSEVTIRPVVSVDEDVIAGGVVIDRVAPNPINGSGSVTITLPRSMNVTMTLVDASGSTVATITNGLLPGGSHQMSIDAAAVSSGMYALQTIVDGARHLQTVMIMK